MSYSTPNKEALLKGKMLYGKVENKDSAILMGVRCETCGHAHGQHVTSGCVGDVGGGCGCGHFSVRNDKNVCKCDHFKSKHLDGFGSCQVEGCNCLDYLPESKNSAECPKGGKHEWGEDNKCEKCGMKWDDFNNAKNSDDEGLDEKCTKCPHPQRSHSRDGCNRCDCIRGISDFNNAENAKGCPQCGGPLESMEKARAFCKECGDVTE